jgi:transcriptional regulator with XRE-family HTH domain
MGKHNGDSEHDATLDEIGSRLRYLRKERWHILQAEVGERLGVAGNAVSLWERGGRMTMDNLCGLQQHFGASIDWLLGGEKLNVARWWYELDRLPKDEAEHLASVFELLLSHAKNKAATSAPSQP